MDYQCIVIYTIVRIAPFYPNLSQTNLNNSPSSSSKNEHSKSSSNGCLDWIKLQIKRWNLFLCRACLEPSALLSDDDEPEGFFCWLRRDSTTNIFQLLSHSSLEANKSKSSTKANVMYAKGFPLLILLDTLLPPPQSEGKSLEAREKSAEFQFSRTFSSFDRDFSRRLPTENLSRMKFSSLEDCLIWQWICLEWIIIWLPRDSLAQ